MTFIVLSMISDIESDRARVPTEYDIRSESIFPHQSRPLAYADT